MRGISSSARRVSLRSMAVLVLVVGVAALRSAPVPTAGAQVQQVSAGGPYSGIVGQPIVMSASTGLFGVAAFQWTWSFGDGTTGFGQSVQKVYSSPGTYFVSVQVQTGQGIVSASTTATVTGQGGSGQVSAGGPYTGAVGQAIFMSGSSVFFGATAFQWTWNFGDGTTGFGQSVQKTYSAAGTYTVTVLVQTGQGSATATTTATIGGQGGSGQISAGGPYSGTVGQLLTMSASTAFGYGITPTVWSWSFGDGTTASGQTVQKSYTSPGSYTVTVTAQVQSGFGVAAVATTSATTTATISGSATPPTTALVNVALVGGCNNVAATWPNGTPISTLISAVSPAGVVTAVWRWDAAANRALGYSPATPAVNDLLVLNRYDAIFVCTSAPATLARPA